MNPFEYPILTLDVESRHLAKDVGGWSKFLAGAGGISALVIHDSWTGRYNCFNDDTLEDAASLIEATPNTILCTFNGKAFDLPLIQALLGRHLRVSNHLHFDLYQLIKSALRNSDPKGGCSLDAVARRTLDVGKEESAEQAPALAAAGKWLRLFRYCKKDVDLTRRLFQFARENGGVISHSGDILPLALPDWLRD